MMKAQERHSKVVGDLRTKGGLCIQEWQLDCGTTAVGCMDLN